MKLAVYQLKFILFEQTFRAGEEVIQRPFFYFGGFEYGINCYFDHILYHCWDDIVEDITVSLETRVGIDLDQPRLHLFIYHEVIS